MMFISVVLPQPDGPTMATNSPSPTSKSSPSMTCRFTLSLRKPLRTFCTAIFAAAGLVCITPPHDSHPFQKPHDSIEQESDEADDDHPGDDQVVTVAGIT